MVLDDEPANRMVISAVLQSNGYTVLEAACGEEAIRICKNRDVTLDLLVADVKLPDVSGTDVAVELMESCPDSAVLFISGTPMAGWTRAELECLQSLPPQSVDFLEKPFTPSTLEEKVRQLVTRQARIKSQQLRPFEYIGWPHGRKH